MKTGNRRIGNKSHKIFDHKINHIYSGTLPFMCFIMYYNISDKENKNEKKTKSFTEVEQM